MVGLDPDTRKMVLDTIREYGKRKLSHERLIEFDKENKYPADIMKELYDPNQVAINLVMIPEKYGGLGGNSFDIYRISELLAGIDLGIATSVFATFLGMDPLHVGATEAQKEKWITKIASSGCLVAYGATEAAAGSDLLHLATRAERVMQGDEIVGYKINGGKMWITNGGVADIFLILARAPKGVSWFIVEKGTKGFVSDKHEDKHGIRLSDTAPLSFHDVYVPAENLVGEVEGKGLRQAQAVFGYTRLMVAAMALGTGWKALEHAIRYSQIRLVGGQPLSTKQGYTHKLIVPFAARLEACRAYVEEVARRIDGGEEGLQTEGAIAKLLASETANKAADNAIQAFGGNGYVREFPVEKLKRDIKITCIYEGTSEILELTTFRARWQENINAEGRTYDKIADEMDALHSNAPDVGAGAASAGLRALSRVLQACFDQKLTHNQIVMMKLGELMAYAETAAAFCRESAKATLSEAVIFDHETWRAMSRIHARQAAAWIASEGLSLVAGASDNDAAGLVDGVNVKAVAKTQKGAVADMDLAAKKLVEVFKAEPIG
ncbi:MAG: acyl-CoA dehydrogenase [Elusimicrobia bacterium RIFCSPLOWO2_12_FULL_59_9]|nr:MAG: acyl-CoA dehydrogenase [Elusimicrobia bacterium RIFCSPLOWO2_12_FULL_59_9]